MNNATDGTPKPVENYAQTPTTSNGSDAEPRAVQNGMSQAEYDTWMWIANQEIKGIGEPYTYAVPVGKLVKLFAEHQSKLDAAVAEAMLNAKTRIEAAKPHSKWGKNRSAGFEEGIKYGAAQLKKQGKK